MPFDWTPAAIDRLKELWHEGLTTNDIGLDLGATKNAVIGKAHRLRLTHRPSPIQGHQPSPTIRLQPRLKEPAASHPAKPAVPTPAVAAHSVVTNRPFARRRDCSWPIGEPGRAGFRFCDAAAEPSKPYCAEHCAVAYAKPRADTTSATNRSAAGP